MCTNFTKNNIERYLNELSKELKKEFGKNSEFELIIVGGASILLNYSFREQTLDVDAFISNQNTIKEAIKSRYSRGGRYRFYMNTCFFIYYLYELGATNQNNIQEVSNF